MTRPVFLIVATAVASVFVAAATATAQPYDHLKCYKIRDRQTFTSANADIGTIESSFPLQNCKIKRKAKQFCIPATKDVTGITGGTDNPFDVPTDALAFEQICYKIVCPLETIATQTISDQFGTRTADHFKASTLCVPAVIGPPPVPTTTSSTTTSTTSTTTSTTTTTTSTTLPPASAWSLRAGNSAIQNGLVLAVDSAGNTIAAGNFFGDIQFGSLPTMSSSGGYDIYAVKIDPSGTPVWSKRFGDASDQQVIDLAIDASDNIVLTGTFQGSVDFGGGALNSAGLSDFFLAELDSSGSHVWSKGIGGSGQEFAFNVEIDLTGDVLVSGAFGSSTLDFGGGGVSLAGFTDCYWARYSSAGTYEAEHTYGAAMGTCLATAIDTTPAGDVLLVAAFSGTIDFGGGGLASLGSSDALVAKYSSTGMHVWSKRFGDTATQQAVGLASDSSGNVYVGLNSQGTVNLGGGDLTSAGSTDVVLAKLDSNGNHVWSHIHGDSASQTVTHLAVDASNNVYAGGVFAGAIDFGPGAVASLGGDDGYIVTYSSAGAYVDSVFVADTGNQSVARIFVTGSGTRYITGAFAGTIDFGDGFGPLGADGTDAYVAKLAP